MNPKLTRASHWGFTWGKVSVGNHRQRLALGPACLSRGKTTQLVSTWILQQGLSGLFHPPAQMPLSRRKAKLNPPLLLRKPQLPFHRLFTAVGVSTLLQAPAALEGEGKVQPSPAGMRQSYFSIIVKHSYLIASKSSGLTAAPQSSNYIYQIKFALATAGKGG